MSNKNTGVATQVSNLTNKTVRRDTPYLGEQDTAQLIHSSRTHRSVSDAFRDADYATPIWRCETDWDRTKECLTWVGVWVGTLFALYTVSVWFNGVVA